MDCDFVKTTRSNTLLDYPTPLNGDFPFTNWIEHKQKNRSLYNKIYYI